MKKIVAYLLSLSLLLACVPTPEEEIVVNKGNQSEMIAASRTEDETTDTNLRTLYHIPEQMNGSYVSADGVVQVTVNAEIDVPDGPLPIVRVYAAEFEQPLVTALWNELVRDTVLYDAWENEETKADIEKDLKNYNDLIGKIQSGELSENDSMYTLDELNEMIAEAQARYPYAQDGHEKTVETGILHKQFLALGKDTRAASQMGISAQSADGAPWMQFRLSNDTDNAEALVHHEGDGWDMIDARRAARFYFDRESEKSACIFASWGEYSGKIHVKREDPIPAEADGNLSITPAQAYAEVDRFLSTVGLSDTFAVRRATVTGASYDKETPNTQFAYFFELTRKVKNTVCNRSMMNTWASKISDDEYAPSWSYETMLVYVDDDGIFGINWMAPVTLGDTINETARLMDFSEIEAIAARMLPMMEVHNLQPEYTKTVQRTIDRVELGLWRVAEQNELGKGMLVPAYCFYGTDYFTRTINDGDHDFTDESYNTRIILILNAVDGSVIDPEKGY